MDENLSKPYSPYFFEKLCPELDQLVPGFQSRQFIYSVFNREWPELSHRQQSLQLARQLHSYVASDQVDAATVLKTVAQRLLAQDAIEDEAQLDFIRCYFELFTPVNESELLHSVLAN